MKYNKYTIVVTGAAGFIGAAVSKKLITNGHTVVGMIILMIIMIKI